MKKVLLNVAALLVLGTLAGPVMAQKEVTKTTPVEPVKDAEKALFDKLGRMIDASESLVKSKEQREGVHTVRAGHKGKWRIDVIPSINGKWVWIEFPCMKVEPARLKDAKWLADLANASMTNGVATFVIDAKSDFLSLKMVVPVKGLDTADLEDYIDQLADKADYCRNLWDIPAGVDYAKK